MRNGAQTKGKYLIDVCSHPSAAVSRAQLHVEIILASLCRGKMTNVNFESVGIPDVGFSLTKVGDQLFFPCVPVFEFVGLSTNSTVVKQGYSCLRKSFTGVSISEPFCKTIRSDKTFLTAEAFLSLVFGGASSFTRSQTFDVDRLLSLR